MGSKQKIQQIYPLSPMQSGMLFHTMAGEESNPYFEQSVLKIRGEIDGNLLEKSFNLLIERYDILRTVFRVERVDKPLQFVLAQRRFKLYYEDISPLDDKKKQRYLEEFERKDRGKGFDLTRDLLVRLSLFKTGENAYCLVWSFHHILMDGWCLGIIYKELTLIYRSLKQGEPLTLAAVVPYANYIRWLEKQDKKAGLDYWRKYLEGYEEPAGLPKTRRKASKDRYMVGEHRLIIDEKQISLLKKIAGSSQTTMNMVFQTLWALVLQRYNNRSDVVFGVVVSGRPPGITGIENMVGLFINTIPLRIRITGKETGFSQLLRTLRESSAASKRYDYLPLAEIQANSLLKGNLIDHIMAFDNYPLQEQLIDIGKEQTPGFQVEDMQLYEQSNYHFNIVIGPGKRYILRFSYNALVYRKDFIEKLGLHLLEVIKQVVEDPNIPINHIEILTAAEKRQILVDFNQTASSYPKDKTLRRLFEEQVEKTPDYIALEGQITDSPSPIPNNGDLISITYRELNDKSNRLAGLLRRKGVSRRHILGLMIDHSIRMLEGILGILKAGAAYLPVDPGYPQNRVRTMLDDCHSRILLTTANVVANHSFTVLQGLRFYEGKVHLTPRRSTISTREILLLDEVTEPNAPRGWHPQPIHGQPDVVLSDASSQKLDFFASSYEILTKGGGPPEAVQQTPGDLAYVIFTSGSSGKPKGVMVEHRALLNLCCWHNRYYQVTESDKAGKYAGFGFDASVWEIFPYLIKGACLHVIGDAVKLDMERLAQYYEKHNITIGFLPTQICEQFMALERANPSLRILLTGGDRLQRFIKRDYRLYNNYGPTENTVVASAGLIDKQYDNIPIGKPIYNTYIYILAIGTGHFHLQPAGVAGELCIGGESLARGYLNRPELTAEKFNHDLWDYRDYRDGYHRSYRSYKSYILYLTGDLARWWSDGNIEFMGRIDQQVKIRGYRIELGEIENRLLEHDHIKQVVVVAVDGSGAASGDTYLCAYIVFAAGSGYKKMPGTTELKERLSYTMPAYMIPSYFVPIEEIPLTASGKLDRQALPDPGLALTAKEYTPPGNQAEELLVDTWQQVLGVKRIGITDNFFEVGGDSIKAMQVSARLKKYGWELKISDLFSNPTIQKSAALVTRGKRTIPQGIVKGAVELTPIQHWFFQSRFTDNYHFNQAVMLFCSKGFAEQILKKVFTKIVTLHDGLRMVYEARGNEAIQVNRGIDGKLFDFDIFDFKDGNDIDIEKRVEKEANKIQRGIDLNRGPLVKLGLFRTPGGHHLLIVIHHLVVDGVSWRILLEDFNTAYRQLEQGEEIRLQDKTDSFLYWARELKAYGEGNAKENNKGVLKELPYWRAVDKEAASIRHLPKDKEIPRDLKKNKHSRTLTITLENKETGLLLRKVNRVYNTEINDILLTALGLAIKEWAGQRKIVINLEGHGRESINHYVDLSRTVGWFTTRYPVILDVSRAHDLSYTIKLVKETLRRIPNKGIGYGILKYLTPAGQKQRYVFEQEPEISFNYLGEFGQEVEPAGKNSDKETDKEGFEMSGLSMGQAVSPEAERVCSIDINGILVQGQLRLLFTWNPHEYKTDRIRQLVYGYKSHLLKIIEYCAGQKTKELTPSDLGYHQISLRDFSNITDHVVKNIDPGLELQSIYPLTPMQSGMLYHALKSESSNAYFEQFVLTITGEIEKERLENSFNRLVKRHDILRTNFIYDKLEEPLQIVFKDRVARVCDEDISQLKENQKQAYLEEFKNRDLQRGFDLSRDMLMRLALFKTAEKSYKLLWSFHHILMDGWCLVIIYRELIRLYCCLKDKKTVNLNAVTPYVHYIQWIEKQDKETGLAYWEKYLEGYEQQVGLPQQGRLAHPDDYKLEEYYLTVTIDEVSRLNKIARDNRVTINTVFQTLWAILLQKYNNCTDVVFGVVVSGRPAGIKGIENMVGLFINTIPLRIRAADNREHGFSQWLRTLQAESALSKKYEFLPLAEIQARSSLKADLMDHLMTLENYPVQEQLKNTGKGNYPGFDILDIESREQTNYHLNLMINPGNSFTIKFSYNAVIYESNFIKRVGMHLKEIIHQVVENRDITFQHLEIITAEEKRQILVDFNQTASSYPRDKTIHGLFAEQAAQTPHQAALVYGDENLTYKELDRAANRLSHYLYRKKKLKPGQPVGLLMSQCLRRPAAILGILKAGGAYVPIDPLLPLERMKYMIADAGINIVAAGKKYIKSLNRLQWECKDFESYLCWDSDDIGGEEEIEKSELMDRELWHHVAETASDEISGGGWVSSYTGEPMSAAEMEEYGDNILKKVTPLLHPRMRVLEIGCASGISMFRIAPKVELYYGTDLSRVIIEKNRKRVKQEGHRNIELASLPAHEIHRLREKNFDLIIMNSVVQCFHGHNYLKQVIRRCIDLSAPGARLFIGDVMDLDKKESLVRQLVEFKKAHKDKKYTAKTDFSTELFLSRGFWKDIPFDFNEIEEVQFSDKIFTIENELTQFRYDLLLKVNKKVTHNDGAGRQRLKFQEDSRLVSNCGTSPLDLDISPVNPAYMIYTSGTTGRPKGAMLDHRGLCSLNTVFSKDFRVGSRDNIIQFANISFDASVWEIFMALLNGASLHLLSRETINDYALFQEYIGKNHITVATLPPPYANHLNVEALRQLRILITAGSPPGIDFIDGCKVYFEYINAYGPTEATICASYWRAISRDNPVSDTVPIGKPINNTRIYILNKRLQLQPIRVAGELCIAGEGLARGYLNRPELTIERFNHDLWDYQDGISQKFLRGGPGGAVFSKSAPPGRRRQKIYFSGDLAWWLSNGDIEFGGRIDRQVKIRGFRIELQEIQGQLLEIEGINEAVVIDREDPTHQEYLCAYIVQAIKIDPVEIKETLSRILPDYMIPAYFVTVDKIPLTPSGKVDQKALPPPELAGTSGDGYAAPRTEIEKALAAIFGEVLLGKDAFADQPGKKPKIGIDDNFFDIGGHSLKATILAAKIHKELEVKVPLAEVFKRQTIRGLSQYLERAGKEKYAHIQPVEKREYYALSSAQKRLFILQQMEMTGTAYNMPQVIPLTGEVTIKQLEKIFKKLIRRHESLRTSFHLIAGEPVQKIHHEVEFEIQYDGLGDRQRAIGNREFEVEFISPFDLSQAPLVRVGVGQSLENRQFLMIDMHHIITDGISQDILSKEFAALKLCPGGELPGLRLRYRDYARWQNSPGQQRLMKQQQAYWVGLYSPPEELPVLNLPTDYPRPEVQQFDGNSVYFVLSQQETQKLKDMAKKADATLYMTILSVYTILLAKLGGQEDIIVGTPIAARRHADLEPIMGMFVNTLAIRNYPQAGKTYQEFINEVKERALKAFENQEYQFEDLVDSVSLRRDTSRNPLFDVMLNLLNQADYSGYIQELNQQRQGSHPYEHREGTSKFDLNLTALDMEKKLLFNFEYSGKLFKPGTIERFIAYFKNIISGLCDFPGLSPGDNRALKLADLEIITREEKEKILEISRGVQDDFAGAATIQEHFREQAARTPDRLALVMENSITYRELNRKSNQLAHLLQQKGVTADTTVGLTAVPAVEMIVAMLAVLKAGGAYLPIEPQYPAERKKYMLQDSSVKILLANYDLQPGQDFPQDVEIIDPGDETIFPVNDTNPLHSDKETRENLLYVIYTSGSTGRPKGVMLEHKNLVNLIMYQYKYTNIDFSRVLQFTAIGFDVSFQEIFSTLLAGGKLFLIERETRSNLPRLYEIIEKNEISTLFLPASYLKFISAAGNDADFIPGSVRHIVSAGEQLIITARFREYLRLNNVYLHNHYGPSETHVVTALTMDPTGELPGIPSIGKPVANTDIYILDKSRGLQVPGVPGDLYIGNAPLGRGYLNQPELTAEKFDLDLWDLQDDQDNYRSYRSYKSYIYRTGDLARRLPDGNIEFLGRADFQVKIRGFRVELGEIENQLLKHEKIKETVVMIQEEKEEKHLCAYVVLHSPGSLNTSKLREYLAGKLPDYMIPGYFPEVQHIPLTINGKVDRKKLPAVTGKRPELANAYAAPRTELEKSIAKTWMNVLGLKQVGLKDNFFELGGNSLKVIQLQSQLQEILKKDIPVVDLFRYMTIGSFIKYLSERETKGKDSLKKEARAGLIDRAKQKQKVQKAKRRGISTARPAATTKVE